jgi:hypothetical protein
MANAYDDATLKVTEGISGMWHYHLSEAKRETRAICGAQTMTTSIPLEEWRVPFGEHFPKRPTWCEKCDAAAAGRKS